MANQPTTFLIEIPPDVAQQEVWDVTEKLEQVEGVTPELQEPKDFITPTLLFLHVAAPYLGQLAAVGGGIKALHDSALQERKEAYKYAGKRITYGMQANDLPEIKSVIREEYQAIHSQVLQDVLKRLDKAFDDFFRRVKAGETPGYPRFQGRNRYNSFTYPQKGYALTHDNRVCLSKIGSIKVKLHRPIEGKIKTCTTKYEAGQWFVIFSGEVEQPEPLPVVESEVGIDLGVTHFAALSDGTFIQSPRFIRSAQADLKRKQRHLSRCKRGSHRRERARKAVAKAHRLVRNQRSDFHQKQSTNLVKQYQVIVFEQLEIKNVTKHAKPKQDEAGNYLPNGAAAKSGLTKSILDAGWGQFQQMCAAKAEYAGRTVLFVNPRYTSQVCSQCGTVRKKELEERWHSCECGCQLDRDVNAAINILRLGRSPQVPHSRASGGSLVQAPVL